MKLKLLAMTLVVFSAGANACNTALVYTSGHSDIGVGFESNGLHLHIHAESSLGLFGGGTLAAGEYDPGALVIGVPGPAEARPVGSQWDFLATTQNAPFWVLPQGSQNDKPFVGLGTEELLVADGWTTDLTWSFDSISLVSGDASSFALYQVDSNGVPDVSASTLIPTNSGNTWAQSAEGHDHYNYGFTGEGIYEVTLSVMGTNAGGGTSGIAMGDYSDTATFRFATGSAIPIAAVPEPSGALFLGIAAAVCSLRRRRS